MVNKRAYRSGKVVWYYQFELPGSHRSERLRITESGFSTRKEAEAAEAARRVEEQRKAELAAAGFAPAGSELPKTLRALLDDFYREHAERKLAATTIEGYKLKAHYLSTELLDMPLAAITPLHLAREWTRLLESGGHHRRTKEPRPLGAKTVRNIAGVVSSAFSRAMRWGLVTLNPVQASEPPVPRKFQGIALSPAQQDLLIAGASVWPMPALLDLAAATGLRRGELLALRWSDILPDGHMIIARSLSQTRDGLTYKEPKGKKARVIRIPPSALQGLAKHRTQQDAFRKQFGPDYQTSEDLVFAQPDGSPLRPDSVSASISALFARLKIPKPKGAALHLLRHSHGSALLAGGIELPTVSRRLGHANPHVTAMVYSHMLGGRDDEAALAWDRVQQRTPATADEEQKGKVQ